MFKVEQEIMICEDCCEHYEEVANEDGFMREQTRCCVCGVRRFEK